MEGTTVQYESDGEQNEEDAANPRSDRGSDTSSMVWFVPQVV